MIAQFLLTRYNADVVYGPRGIGASPDWLEHRLKLFKAFCRASILGQSTKEFTWIIQVNEHFPSANRDQFLAEVAGLPVRVVVAPSAVFSEEVFIEAIRREVAAKDVSAILTTRIDNDDAIATGFLERVRHEAELRSPEKTPFVIDVLDGCQASKSGVHAHHYALNPFLSVVCSASNITTAFHADHKKMWSVGPVIDLRTDYPNWVQTIHSRNVYNKPRGSRKLRLEDLQDFSLSRNWQEVLENA